MGYHLGVDIGTTYTAAAVWRDGRGTVASLGNRAPTIPSVVLLRDDATVLVGEPAARRAASEPGRVAREFKRRVGDPTPIIVGGTPYSADALMARLLRAVVDLVVQAEGGPPDGVAVTHPANWGPYKLDLLHQAVRLADIDDVVTVSEPEAAAIHYASQARIEPGSVIAVYDLGGGTFDTAVLRKADDVGWTVLGAPEGIERLGGVDFDAAVYHHVATAVGPTLDGLSPDDPAAMAGVARLRQECVDAKEALSSDSDVSIPVMLPGLQTQVRLTRSEYEQMVRPALADTITALTRALRSASVAPEDVTTVLLVGGSSRTPLVAELVSTALRRPVAVDAHPKHGVALGAALTAAQRTGDGAADDAGAPVAAGNGNGNAGRPTAGVAAAAAAETAAAAAAPPATVPGPRPAGADPAPSLAEPSAVPSSPVRRDVPAAPAPAGDAVPVTASASPASAGTAEPPVPTAPATVPTPAALASPAGDIEAAPRPDRPTTSSTPPPARVSVPAPAAAAGGSTRDTRSVRVPYTGETAAAVGPARDHSAGTGDDLPPVRPNGTGSGSRPRRGLVAAVAAAVVVVVAIAGFALWGAGDDDDSGGGDAATAAAPDDVAGEASASEGGGAEVAAGSGLHVQIEDIRVEGGFYSVTYTVDGFDPLLDGGPGSQHIHFFLDSTERANAGTNGTPPGTWYVTDESSEVVTDFGPDTRGDASQMCALVADVDHGVFDRGGSDTGNCVDLPE